MYLFCLLQSNKQATLVVVVVSLSLVCLFGSISLLLSWPVWPAVVVVVVVLLFGRRRRWPNVVAVGQVARRRRRQQGHKTMEQTRASIVPSAAVFIARNKRTQNTRSLNARISFVCTAKGGAANLPPLLAR